MNTLLSSTNTWQLAAQQPCPPDASRLQPRAAAGAEKNECEESLQDAFQSFVGETLFGQMLKAMRKTVNKPAYFHGGRAEEVFSQQLDQILAEKMARSDGAKYSNAMYDLFRMKRS